MDKVADMALTGLLTRLLRGSLLLADTVSIKKITGTVGSRSDGPGGRVTHLVGGAAEDGGRGGASKNCEEKNDDGGALVGYMTQIGRAHV